MSDYYYPILPPPEVPYVERLRDEIAMRATAALITRVENPWSTDDGDAAVMAVMAYRYADAQVSAALDGEKGAGR